MNTFYPTKTRLALLAEIAAGHVFRDAIGDSYITAGAKVTARIHELLSAGWVAPADYGEWWRLTAAGYAVLEAAA